MPEAIRAATVADAVCHRGTPCRKLPRSAYRGILKDSTLGPTLDDDRRTHWRGEVAAMAPTDTVLIADGLGFIAAWAEGDPSFGAYIDNLHVRPERRSAGVGRQLLGAAMRQVAGRGEARAYLWVFDGNTRAIEFYRRLGGEIVEGGFEEIDGLKIPQSRIVWRDTLRLVEACARSGARDFLQEPEEARACAWRRSSSRPATTGSRPRSARGSCGSRSSPSLRRFRRRQRNGCRACRTRNDRPRCRRSAGRDSPGASRQRATCRRMPCGLGWKCPSGPWTRLPCGSRKSAAARIAAGGASSMIRLVLTSSFPLGYAFERARSARGSAWRR